MSFVVRFVLKVAPRVVVSCWTIWPWLIPFLPQKKTQYLPQSIDHHVGVRLLKKVVCSVLWVSQWTCWAIRMGFFHLKARIQLDKTFIPVFVLFDLFVVELVCLVMWIMMKLRLTKSRVCMQLFMVLWSCNANLYCISWSGGALPVSLCRLW